MAGSPLPDVWCFPTEGFLIGFFIVSVRSGALGFFCSVGQSVSDKWVGINWLNLLSIKSWLCVFNMYNNYGTVLTVVFCRYVDGQLGCWLCFAFLCGHLHTDKKNFKYCPIIIIKSAHTHTINFLWTTTLANLFQPIYHPQIAPRYKKSPRAPLRTLISKNPITEELHSENTSHSSNGDPATNTTGI